MQRSISRCLDVATRNHPRIPFSVSRQFSISLPRRANTLMETSGFSDTQLQVREAIAKICSNFPDVSSNDCDFNDGFVEKFSFRNIGQPMMNQGNILMNYMLPLRKMGGLALHFLRILVEQA